MYAIRFSTDRVRKQFDNLSDNVFTRVDAVVCALEENPFPRGVRKLTGKRDSYRIRVGDYRIIYEINPQKNEIILTRVGHRSEVYQ